MQRVPRSAHVAAPLVVLLGRFGLIDTATPVFLTPALQRLLAYVALSGRTVSRDRVAGVLWATVAETHAHMSLRAALARLSARAPGLLHGDGGEVTLGDDVRIDLHEAQLN